MNPQTLSAISPCIVLAVGAHADDIDFGASGSIAKWAQDGAEVHYLVLTDGSKGSSDENMTTEELVKIREQEQRDAANALGAKHVHFLGHEDTQLEVTIELKKQITRLIRQIKPDVVIVMDPTMIYVAELGFINHTDHRAAGQATLDAIYPLARDRLTFPDLYAEGLKPHKVEHLLLINLEKQNFFVDISDTFETKLAGLGKHMSQVTKPEQVRTMLTERAEALGKLADCKYAEAFVRIDLPD